MLRWAPWLLFPTALLLAGAQDPEVPVARPRAPGWSQRHQDKLQEIRQGRVELIFLGDSITQELESTNPAWGNINGVWQHFYGCRHAVNLGFNGDSTGNVLWRIDNGEIDGLSPKVAVLMVGTNNIRPAIESTAGATARDIERLVDRLHQRLPSTRILLLGIPPSGRLGTTERERLDVNALLSGRDWAARNASFLNIDTALESGGRVDFSLFRPGRTANGVVHPNAQGWQKLAEAIEPSLTRLLGGEKCP